MNEKKYFISRNYKARFSAAGKAKIDCEQALEKIGFRNLGLGRTTYTSTLPNFFFTLLGTLIGLTRLPWDSVLCVQYPTKKYYDLIVKVAKLKRCRVITIIHDLRSHRKQKMAIDREMRSLNRNDLVIAHNAAMSAWLTEHGLTIGTVNLNIFDYLCDFSAAEPVALDTGAKFRLVFAGVLEKRKNGFLYQLDELDISNFSCNLYGVGFNPSDLPAESIIDYRGVFPADEIVERIEGEFGIVWDGTSLGECAGSFGEYLKINNPHKTSMYLRAGLPVVIWDQAAMARLVRERNVGIAVASLADVDGALANLTAADYLQMRTNAREMSRQLGEGLFLSAAIGEAMDRLAANGGQ